MAATGSGNEISGEIGRMVRKDCELGTGRRAKNDRRCNVAPAYCLQCAHSNEADRSDAKRASNHRERTLVGVHACSQQHGEGTSPDAQTTAHDHGVDAAAPISMLIDGGGDASGAELCDGSADVRLDYRVEGGGASPLITTFTTPRADWTYFFVDGTCRFYVSDNSVHGIRTGTLDTTDATQLATDIAWNELDGWRDYGTHNGNGCADAPVDLLAKPGVAVGCACGCGSLAPNGLDEAVRNARRWVMQLWQRGGELTTPVSVVANPTARADSQYVPWPLTRSMDSIADLIMDPNDERITKGPYARFDSGTDASVLRELRSKSFDPQAESIPVSESGKTYDLYVRDELPDETARALERFYQH